VNPLQRGSGGVVAAASTTYPAGLLTSMVILVSSVALFVTRTLVGGSGSPGHGEMGNQCVAIVGAGFDNQLCTVLYVVADMAGLSGRLHNRNSVHAFGCTRAAQSGISH